MQLSWMTAHRARLGLCAVLAGVFLLAMASPAVSSPEAPEVPAAEDPPEGCEERDGGDDTDEEGGFQYDTFSSNGQAYYFCDFGWEGQDDCLIFTYINDWDGETFCAVDGKSIMIKCRNEEAHWNDKEGGVLVPVDYKERGWEWWVKEIEYESLDETQRREGRETDGDEIENNKNLGAQGCALGSEPPRRDCESVREERIRKLEEISSLKAERRNLDPSNSDRRAEIDSEIERLTQDVRDLADIGGIIPDDCWGTHPTSRYEVTWDADDFSLERLMGWVATIAFGFGKMAIGTALWLLGFGFTFDVTEYLSTVSSIASSLDRELIHLGDRGNAFTLFNLAWFGLFAYAGFQLVRGRMARAGMEILVSVVLFVLASVFVVVSGNPGGSASQSSSFSVWEYATSFGELIDRSSAAMLMLASDDWDINDDLYCPGYLDDDGDWHVDESDPDECSKYIYRETNIRQLVYDNQSRIHEEFVERPYMFINWNQEFGDDACMAAINHTLTTPYSGDGWEQRFLDRVTLGVYDLRDGQLVPVSDPIDDPPNCGKMSKFNGEMTVNRMMSAIFVTIVSVTVAVLLGMVAAGLLVVKFLAGLAFAMLPLMVVFAVMPNRARGIAWWWLGFIVQLWLGAMALGLMLAFMMWILDAIYTTTEGMPLAERWLMVLMLMAVLFFVRKQLMSGSQRIAQNITDRMTNITEGGGGGGGGGWVRPGPGAVNMDKWSGGRLPGIAGRYAAMTGVPMAGNAAMAAAGGVMFGAMRMAGTPFRRMGENRVAKKNLRNLERMDMLRRRRDLQAKHMDRRQGVARQQSDRWAARKGKLDGLRKQSMSPYDKRVAAAQKETGRWWGARQQEGARLGALQRGLNRTNQRETRLMTMLNNGEKISGKGATGMARSMGLSSRDIAMWNARPGASPGMRNALQAKVTNKAQDRRTQQQALIQRTQNNLRTAKREHARAQGRLNSARADHAKVKATWDKREERLRTREATRRRQENKGLESELMRERKDFSDQARAMSKSERKLEWVRWETPYQEGHHRHAEGKRTLHKGGWRDPDRAEVKRESKRILKRQKKRDGF